MSKAQELEEARKNSLKQSLIDAGNLDDDSDDNGGQDDGDDDNKSDNNKQVPQKKFGNDNNSTYLEDEDSDEDSDEISNDDQDDSKSVLNKVFNGNVENLENSYLESQREYNKLNQEHKQVLKEYEETQNLTNQVDRVLKENPSLRSLFEKAVNNEDVESLINNSSKPASGKSSNNSDQGKLEVDDEFLPTTERLIESGYLDENYDNLSDFDRERAVLTAQNKFLQEQMPNLVSKQVQTAYKQQREQEQQKQERKQLSDTNTERFENGFDEAVVEFGLNFTSDHKDLFDEIYEEAKSFRDPNDQRLIRDNAVILATQHVLQRHNIDPDQDTDTNKNADDKGKKSRKQEKRLFTTTGKRQEVKKQKNDEPQTIEQAMRQKQAERLANDLDSRKNKYKLDR